MKSLKKLTLFFLSIGVVFAQQIPDPNFDAAVTRPTYTTTHPSVAIDQGHDNFHTKDGLFRPFAVFAALTLILLIGMVLTRVLLMNRQGIKAVKFGNIDKKDFLIPPFALFYFYVIFAESFPLPAVSSQAFFRSHFSPWIGVAFCAGGLGLLLWSLISFGRSFRVGIDTDRPDRLITSGIFAISRNPIYVAFAAVLVGQFLIFPNWILLVYTAAATWLFHRQILREEEYLKKHYGAEYANYSRRVRRYL